jgi:hypothetical protein
MRMTLLAFWYALCSAEQKPGPPQLSRRGALRAVARIALLLSFAAEETVLGCAGAEANGGGGNGGGGGGNGGGGNGGGGNGGGGNGGGGGGNGGGGNGGGGNGGGGNGGGGNGGGGNGGGGNGGGTGSGGTSSGPSSSGASAAAGPGGAAGSASGSEQTSWIAAPPTNAAFDAAHALVERDSHRLGLLGPPLSPAGERALILRHWR